MIKKAVVLSTAAIVLAATSAFATVIFDPASGTGWVGKGDVQMAYGWNNKTMQANHTAITFEYDATTHYEWVCEWTTNEGKKGEKTHSQARTTTVGVAGQVGNRDRMTGQWTGWFLTGYTSSAAGSSEDFEPTCPGNDEGDGGSGEKTVVEGSLVATPMGQGLYVAFSGVRGPQLQ
jgi:hypothetical protein